MRLLDQAANIVADDLAENFTFSATFMLAALIAIGAEIVRLEDI